MMLRLYLSVLLLGMIIMPAPAQDLPNHPGSVACHLKKVEGSTGKDLPSGRASDTTHSFDVLKYTLDLDLYSCYNAPYFHNFKGVCTVNFRAEEPLSMVALNAASFSISIDSVTAAGVSFLHSMDTLRIQLDRMYNAGEVTDITIHYHHKNVLDNAFYCNNGMVFTDAEPEGARKWFPCWDRPSDKALLDLTAKVKANVRLGSNGHLADSVLSGDSLWYHWVSNQNVATYLVVLSSKTNYNLNITYWKKPSNPADSIPFLFYFNLGEDPSPIMELLPEMADWFSEHFIEHPFDKNGFATLDNSFPWGGMENQTLTSLCPGCWSEGLIAHEFAHQWFGDMITCRTWADLWLNEGFATWSEAFWYEQDGGFSAYKQDIDGLANYYLWANPGWAISDPDWAVTTPPDDILFNYAISYAKGAAVVHMLRYVLGDSLFYQTLHAYCSDTNLKFHSAGISDFRLITNQVTGQDYSWFFNQWLLEPNHPIYNNTFNFTNLGAGRWQVHLFLKQVQTNPLFFKMPVEIRIRFLDNSDTTVRFMNETNSQQVWLEFSKQPVALYFDPDNQIVLKGGNTVVGVQETPTRKEVVSHVGCRPNPATAESVIFYNLYETTDIRIDISDISGARVKECLNSLQQGGFHELRVDLSALKPGTYLCNVRTGTACRTIKLLIIDQ